MSVVKKDVFKIYDCLDIINKNTTEFDSNDILCAFDVDNTIIVLECKYSYWPNVSKYSEEFSNIKSKYNIDKNLIYMNMSLNYPSRVFDNKIYDLIENLKCKKLMLTASLAGNFLNIDWFEKHRYDLLSKLKISFENEFNVNEHIIFKEFKPNLNNYPTYYKGILFTNGDNCDTTKGKVLRMFLNTIKYKPKCIVIIDDNPENHNSIETEFSDDTEKIISILYKGTDNYCPIEIDKDEFISFWENSFASLSEKYKNII